jgi:hypothetical protein
MDAFQAATPQSLPAARVLPPIGRALALRRFGPWPLDRLAIRLNQVAVALIAATALLPPLSLLAGRAPALAIDVGFPVAGLASSVFLVFLRSRLAGRP